MNTSASPEEGTFLAPWKPDDASSLQPELLPIAKVTRAWDRRPQAPSARTHKRVGTIWKRPSAMTPSFSSLPHLKGNFLRRKSGLGGGSPRVAIKKQCLDTEFGMGSAVSRWDVRGSPIRKIVTRSDAVADQELVALNEDEDAVVAGGDLAEDEEGDVTVEIRDEDGTIVAVGDQSLGEGQDWHDVPEETRVDERPMHLESALRQPELDDASVDDQAGLSDVAGRSIGSTTQTIAAVAPNVVLPEGFVSPVKRQRRPLGAKSRQAARDRRQTLPLEFAPAQQLPASKESHARDEVPSLAEPDVAIRDHDAVQSIDIDRVETAQRQSAPLEAVGTEAKSAGDSDNEEWEDVEDDDENENRDEASQDEIESPDAQMSDAEAIAAQLAAETEASQSLIDGHNTSTDIEDRNENDATLLTTTPPKPTNLQKISERALTSSPIPTIASPHPRLPLRRSPRREPRRQSASPLKQSTTICDVYRSHLIAFTPLRRPFASVIEAYSPAKETRTKEDSPRLASSPEPPSAAPAIEARMSPTKTSRPRVSDDTALLQAFLNRAAESKHSRRSSTVADVEALANRRDSDTVKKALASPSATADVLGELDPNSPSPRKAVTIVPESPLGRGTIDQADGPIDQEDETVTLDLGEPVQRTRSGRARKKPQLLAQSAPLPPNRIQIRGQSGSVDIRKSEAQEVAIMTRNNTRKNKGQAQIPTARLKTLASGEEAIAPQPTAEQTAPVRAKRRRNVTWAENLVAYSGDAVEPETSILSLDTVTTEQESAQSAPPPMDTPSKPKMRRLRTTKTMETQDPAPTDTVAPETKTKSAQTSTRRRQRVGTPAKGLGNASLLPDLDPIEEPLREELPAAVEKKPVSKKRVTSRIPAPASSLTAQGKENIISSPAKKKVVSSLPTSKTFAPKLEFARSGATEALAPGLASPAKKAGRRIIQFGDDTKRHGNDDTMTIPSLASPAKKRTRRTAA